MTMLPTGVTCARWMAWLSLACGVIYSVGGLVLDLRTTGLNRCTALAFLALADMPVLFDAAGFLLGVLVAAVDQGVRAVLAGVRR